MVTITAYDGTQSKTEFIRVRVTNVNEKPTFDEGPTATREVEADAEVNDLFGDPVTATDPDGDLMGITGCRTTTSCPSASAHPPASCGWTMN